MLWDRYLRGAERIEEALSRFRERLLPQAAPTAARPVETGEDLRLFPIVGRDLCYPVAALLARGELEEVGRLVSKRAWVASTPFYG